MNRRCQGFSLVMAIFLLVVVASLGAYMVTIGSTQRQTSTLSVLGARAFAAAESGMEWGVAQVISTDACFASPSNFTLNGGMASGYGISATCSATNHTEGASAFKVFRVTVTAARGTVGSADYVERTIRASVTTAP